MTRSSHRLLLLLLLAFALRLYRLTGQSIWMDESISLHLATSSLPAIVADRASNIHPPLYFFLLKGWLALAGVGIFQARFLSVMGSTLQVALIHTVTRRLLPGRPPARLAACLTAIFPPSVVYSQEIRVYAILPSFYLLLLLLTHTLTARSSPRRRSFWALLAVTEIIALHLHYIVIFLLAYLTAWAILSLWRTRRTADLRRYLLTQAAVGLAGLPWLTAVALHLNSARTVAATGPALATFPPLDYLASQIWTFHLTGLAGALSHPALRRASALTLLLLLLPTAVYLLRSATRRRTVSLLTHWLLPLGLTMSAWLVRPFSHPRYIIIFTPGLTLLAAFLERHPPRPTTAHRLPTASLTVISILALNAYFHDPAFAKNDLRPVARYLEQTAASDDLILLPDGDRSLNFLYRGDTPLEMAGMPDEQTAWDNLARLTAARPTVFLLSHRHGISPDPRGLLPFALESAGRLQETRPFDNLLVRVYTLTHPVAPPPLTPVAAHFPPLTITRGWVEPQAPSGGALTLALRWQLDGPTPDRYSLSLRLLDTDGWPPTSRDTLLLDGSGRPTDRWPPAVPVTTYHTLPLPPDLPPLTYTIALGLYARTDDGGIRPLDRTDDLGHPQGQQLTLAVVSLTRSGGPSPYGLTVGPPPLPEPLPLPAGLSLLGISLDREQLTPGDPLFVLLRWRADVTPLPDLRPALVLIQNGRELAIAADAPALGRYPTDRWALGETILEHRRLTVPPTAADGPADLLLTLGDTHLPLGSITIATGSHTFTPPPVSHPLNVRFGPIARLIGYDLLPGGHPAGRPITLTLYWQAIGGSDEHPPYTVFTHLLSADGRVVAQHDSPPAAGTRPTTGWLPGEIITDRHRMTFREPYTGPATVEIGLYDPATLERVPTESGTTGLVLPTALEIMP